MARTTTKHHAPPLARLLATAAISLALLGCHRRYAYTSVPSGAMAPTIKPGQVVNVDFNAYKGYRSIHRWDIIAFRERHSIIVKRVIGLPGESIRLKPDGKTLFVNNHPVPVPKSIPWFGHHLTRRKDASDPIVGKTVHVPPKTVYVLGDDLNISEDSRDVGPIKLAAVTGKIVLHPPKQPAK